ncbi:MAG TPA: CheR family methyltransferase [Oculatellaceae cyanobacterium]|jgi:chemotaxis protein methyltransferase WspC
MVQATIEALLRQKIGLETASIGSNTIARAIRQRMSDCGLSDMQEYVLRLQASALEMEELIETIVVPETWFFRDRQPFNFLGTYVITEWLPKHPGGILRVLSVPCSTGEEPYSIAIALIEAGLATKNFRIDAVDISKRALAKAQRAVYERNSFRGNDINFRDRYFQKTADGYQLYETISSTVNFINANLLDPWFLLDQLPYDIIFCRNLLIYLDNTARERAIKVIDRLLTKKGLLFVGHSETGQVLNNKFTSVRHSLAFAYRKLETETKVEAVSKSKYTNLLAKPSQTQQSTSVHNLPANNTPLADLLAAQSSSKLNPPVQKPQPIKKWEQTQEVSTTDSTADKSTIAKSQQLLLDTARNLANQGTLDQAASLCETYLHQNRINPEAYVLLGEVHQASGKEDQAEECYNKAIYLEPNHYEALMHLVLIKERRGDIVSASILRQRIQRIAN